jgi:PAS domain S-box-containing protein
MSSTRHPAGPRAETARTAATAKTPLHRAFAASGDALWDWDLGPAQSAGLDDEPAWLELVHEDDREALLRLLQRHRADPAEPCVAEFRLRSADGRWRWMRGRGRIVAAGRGGRRQRLLGLLSDVDDRHRQLQDLELSRARFQAIYETTPDAMGITRIADGRYLDVNSGFEHLTGFSRSEAIGRTSVELGIWATVAERMALVEAFRRDGEVTSMPLSVRHRDGTVVKGLMSVRGMRIDAQDCFLFTYRDITAHDRMQEEAVQARNERASAEAANRAKTDFLSRMSHELRTPLNAVLGFSQLLLSEPGERLGERQAAQVDAIRHAGWHLLALINDVLDVSRIEAGKLLVAPRAVDVSALLDEVLALVGTQAQSSGVVIVPAYRRAASTVVAADPVRLRQVMLNVVTNAVKYNRPAGTVHLAVEEAAGRATVVVADTGLGMTRDQLAHLFEPFNRLGRERSGIEGTGIGMALTRQLTELMNGTIEVRSEAGTGTTVRIALPLADSRTAPAARVDTAMPGADPGAGTHCAGTVLYVEDNAINQLIVEQMLARWSGLRLVMADSGERGIALARQLRPDLLLLDMRLPDLSGQQVLDALRADPSTRDLRVVALSASAMPDEVALASERGVLEYWTKPLDLTRFLDGIRRLLNPAAA